MSSEGKIHRVGLKDVAQYYGIYANQKHSTLNSLVVFREFDAKHPEVSAYHVQALRGLPSLLAITDPKFATDTARAHDYIDFSTQTIVKKGLAAPRGSFILNPSDRDQWKQDRKTMLPAYGSSQIERYTTEIRQTAHHSIDRYLEFNGEEFSADWLKCIALDQITTHVVGQPLDQKVVYKAAQELQRFTRHTALIAAAGSLPSSHRNELVMKALPNYRTLLANMYDAHLNSPASGMLGKMLTQYPEREKEAYDILSTMVSGVGFIPTQIGFTAWNLANDREKQEQARQDQSYLWKCMLATNLMYPAVPYTGRVVTEKTEIGGAELRQGSAVVFANAAYGGEKYISNAHIFDPERPNLEEMAKKVEGNAHIFGNGVHKCPATHFAPYVVHNTLTSLLDRWQVGVSNDEPINPVLGNATLVTQKPIPLVLTDRTNNHIINAHISW